MTNDWTIPSLHISPKLAFCDGGASNHSYVWLCLFALQLILGIPTIVVMAKVLEEQYHLPPNRLVYLCSKKFLHQIVFRCSASHEDEKLMFFPSLAAKTLGRNGHGKISANAWLFILESIP